MDHNQSPDGNYIYACGKNVNPHQIHLYITFKGYVFLVQAFPGNRNHDLDVAV